MMKRTRLTIFNSIMAANAFCVALLSIFGAILKSDIVGRVIFAFTWIMIGVWWISRLVQHISKPKNEG
jgi:hypothetical protein